RPGARDLPALGGEFRELGAAPAPRGEPVGGALGPAAARGVAVAGEPLGAPELRVRLDQVGAELERLPEERLRVLVHLAVEVDEAEVVVGVERGLAVVVEPDDPGEVLDRLAEDPLL